MLNKFHFCNLKYILFVNFAENMQIFCIKEIESILIQTSIFNGSVKRYFISIMIFHRIKIIAQEWDPDLFFQTKKPYSIVKK